MGTIRLTVAQALIKFLNNQYIECDGVEEKFVEGIFTIFGHGNVLGIGQALYENAGDLTVHQGRSEQGMAHAATGFAKQKLRRKIYACTSSVGPGAANMITAAATATANRIPILLLPGDVFATRQPDPVLQQIEQPYDLSISTNDAFRAVSKYWDRVSRPEQLMTAMINAMRVLTDPADTGAVTLCLPQDVQGEAYDYPDYFFQKRVHHLDRLVPNERALEEAINLLNAKKKPLIICGGGVKYSDAGEALQRFCEKFHLPFAETQAGKGTLPSDFVWNMGGIGETGGLAANLLASDCDLVIGIGTRYTDFTTSSKWLFQNPEMAYININVSKFDGQKLDAVLVQADAKCALEKLLDNPALSHYENDWNDKPAQAKQAYLDEVKRVYQVTYSGDDFVPEVDDDLDRDVLREFAKVTGSTLTQSRVLGILNESLGDSDVIVGAAGSLPGDLQRVWQSKGKNNYHLEYGYSCMGYEINAGLGVKLAEPEKEVFVMVGDGSYMMAHSELVTSIQERQKINVVLFDNMAFGCINNLEIGNGLGSFGTEFRYRNDVTGRLDGQLIPIDFAQSAAAYGCKTYAIHTEAELRAALADARHQQVSTLFDIKVLPKTMVHGYLSWWRVGGAEVAEDPKIVEKSKASKENIKKARQY